MQIAREPEVKAQIKLRLRKADGTSLVVSRSFMLTQAKSKKTFKTLDGSIMAIDAETNQMEGVSNKCSEIDKLVPMLMNVSRPILEHVVFVHQEDSLWPLSESTKLKEKFDSIFAATKYTEAIKRMNEVVKTKNAVRADSLSCLCFNGVVGSVLACVCNKCEQHLGRHADQERVPY